MDVKITELEIIGSNSDGHLKLIREADCEFDCCKFEVYDEFYLDKEDLKSFNEILTNFMNDKEVIKK